MNNKLGKAIYNFRENPCDHTAKAMKDYLWNEIIDAVKGQKISRCGVARRSFKLIYPEDCKDRSNCIAGEVELIKVKNAKTSEDPIDDTKSKICWVIYGPEKKHQRIKNRGRKQLYGF